MAVTTQEQRAQVRHHGSFHIGFKDFKENLGVQAKIWSLHIEIQVGL
jgi:hypothetical protein